jgi:hypothetical protein
MTEKGVETFENMEEQKKNFEKYYIISKNEIKKIDNNENNVIYNMQ